MAKGLQNFQVSFATMGAAKYYRIKVKVFIYLERSRSLEIASGHYFET
jgi:hypothetical protein